MTTPNNPAASDFNLETFLQEKHAFEQEIRTKNTAEIERVFTNEDERAIISDIFTNLHDVSLGLNSLSEAFLQNLVAIQAFYQNLVGDGKTISNEAFGASVDEAYDEALKQQQQQQK